MGPWGGAGLAVLGLGCLGVAAVAPLLLLAVLGMSVLFGRSRMFAVRRVPAWRSATGGVAGESHYTPFGFANPTRKVLATVLLTRSELTVLERESGGRTDDPHRSPAGAHLGYLLLTVLAVLAVVAAMA